MYSMELNINFEICQIFHLRFYESISVLKLNFMMEEVVKKILNMHYAVLRLFL